MQLGQLEDLVLLDLQDQQALLDPPVPQGKQAIQVQVAQVDHKDKRDKRDHRGLVEILANLAPQGLQDR